MRFLIRDILHLRTVKEQLPCVVNGCRNWGQRRSYEGDYYVLCAGHRRLAKDRYLNKVPMDYIPAMAYGSRATDYKLPLPPLWIDIKPPEGCCKVKGCGNPVEQSKQRCGKQYIVINSLCKRHRTLRQRGLPEDYVFKREKKIKQSKCIVEGCHRLQANKGLDGEGIRRYDLYCEYHRRGRHKTQKKARLTLDLSKCSIDGEIIPCDRHRIVNGKDGGKYETGNVISVCPNCHRKIHLGLLKI